MVLVDMLGMLS